MQIDPSYQAPRPAWDSPASDPAVQSTPPPAGDPTGVVPVADLVGYALRRRRLSRYPRPPHPRSIPVAAGLHPGGSRRAPHGLTAGDASPPSPRRPWAVAATLRGSPLATAGPPPPTKPSLRATTDRTPLSSCCVFLVFLIRPLFVAWLWCLHRVPRLLDALPLVISSCSSSGLRAQAIGRVAVGHLFLQFVRSAHGLTK